MDSTNFCIECRASLTVYADDEHMQVREQGETECCCGDIDCDGNYFNASCLTCCAKNHNHPQIWEGKSTGGGFYIVNPGF